MKLRSFDFIFGFLCLVLILFISLILWRGDRTFPYVKDFNFSLTEPVSVKTRQLVFNFNREMDKASVEAHFKITPPLPGKFSWVGKTMAYSFEKTLDYDQVYEVQLPISVVDSRAKPLKQDFSVRFKTEPQTLFYIGMEKEEKDHLVLYDFSSKIHTPLSPPSLKVADYSVHPQLPLVYLLANEKGKDEDILNLYEFNWKNGDLTSLVKGEQERIFEFKLSPNGQWLAASLGARRNVGEFQVTDQPSVQLMNTHSREWAPFWWNSLYGSPLEFSPDSQFLVGIDYSEDILVLPLHGKDVSEAVPLGRYSGFHGFSPNGKMLLLSNESVAFSEMDLLLRKDDGSTQLLASGMGQIFYPVFDAANASVYFLVANFTEEKTEDFFNFYRYDLNTSEVEPLIQDPFFAQGYFSLSSGGSFGVLERYVVEGGQGGSSVFEVLAAQAPELWKMNLKTGELFNLGLRGKKPLLN